MRIQNVCRLTVAAILCAVTACEEEQITFAIPGDRVESFQATLTGAGEVPPVTTAASATTQLDVVFDTILIYRLVLAAVDSPVTAHLHPSSAGAEREADTLLILLAADTTRRTGITGQMADGQLRPSQLSRLPLEYGTTAGARFDSLLSLMRAGNVYVHVHTRGNSGGEIRGQVQAQ